MKSRRAVFVCLCAMLVSLPAAAEIPAKSLYVGVHGGVNLVLDDWDLGPKVDPMLAPKTGGAVGLRVGFHFDRFLALELGGTWLPIESGAGASGNAVSTTADLLIHFPASEDWAPLFSVGGGLYKGLGDDIEDVDYHIHYGLGVRGMLTGFMALRVDARHMMTDGFEADSVSNNFEITAGLDFYAWTETHPPKIVDTDGDGIQDPVDACPTVAGVGSAKGCPDADGDGIVDSKDRCVDAKGDVAMAGCPDTDGDGIADPDDKCADVQGTADHGGCPDSDGDGIIDSADKCPKTKGVEAHGGCVDSDGDGIADPDDQCPEKPGIQAEKGCLPAAVEEKFSGAFDGIHFKAGSDKIRRKSFAVLDEAAALLVKFPTVRIAIEGHTDDRGKGEKNLALSKARAESVKAYLVEKGVAAERMEATGFGQTKPIADNKTRKGRTQNRRIEIRVIR